MKIQKYILGKFCFHPSEPLVEILWQCLAVLSGTALGATLFFFEDLTRISNVQTACLLTCMAGLFISLPAAFTRGTRIDKLHACFSGISGTVALIIYGVLWERGMRSETTISATVLGFLAFVLVKEFRQPENRNNRLSNGDFAHIYFLLLGIGIIIFLAR